MIPFLVQECHVNEEALDNEGRTALHGACRAGNRCLVRYLIQEGQANVEARDKLGRTPLHHAVRDTIDIVLFWYLV